MINLRCRTEYNYGRAYGQIEKIIAANKGKSAIGIADIGTWGHVNFYNDCIAAGIKPILGAEIAIVPDAKDRTKQPPNYMAFLARNNTGLEEIYNLVTESTENFFYFPRLDYERVSIISDNVIILSGSSPRLSLLKARSNLFVEHSFMSPQSLIKWSEENNVFRVATINNYYPAASDKSIYQILLGKDKDNKISPMHICDENELLYHLPNLTKKELNLSDTLAGECEVTLPQAQLVTFAHDLTLEQICRKAAKKRDVDLSKPEYNDRLMKELSLIKDKGFNDYFYVLWDLIAFAKTKMLVGPARGSSCGSLVCYLLGITEIDPLKFDLLFERFIDATRKDLPDIDIDFADDKRDLVFDYLKQKYGADCVARLGTISRFKARSAIGCVAKEALIPEWEINDFKENIIIRNVGDERAKFCIADTISETEIGQDVVSKFPAIKYAGDLEYHASHSGQHAAGIVITNKPVSNFCSFDKKTGALHVDKYDAEKLNLLKIDALGLRTLSILQDVLDQVGKTREWLYQVPIDDQKAFDVINAKKYSGIFQFEGYALQGLAAAMPVESLEDIVAITALARPGPLNSGSAADFVNRRVGKAVIDYFHPLCEPITSVTLGTIIYQEQVMRLAREVGNFSWEDVSSLRKVMGKTLGEASLNKYWQKFKEGCFENDIEESDAQNIWDHIKTMGAYAFNRSHAVAYGLLSYWCCYLKYLFPLEFAVANLRNAKDDSQAIRLLRELSFEGIHYEAFCPEKSDINWTIHNGKLIGGYLGIKNCGQVKAKHFINCRKNNIPLTASQAKMLENPQTPYNDIWECHTRFGHIKADPQAHNVVTPIKNIAELNNQTEGEFVVFGKLKEKEIKDMNETKYLAKRGGSKITENKLWLNITIEDDTASILCRIDRYKFEKIGKPIIQFMQEDKDWLMVKGKISKGFRVINVDRIRHMTPRTDMS